MRIGVIGTGVIASAVVRGLAGQEHEITVSERTAERAFELAQDIPEVQVADNQNVLANADVVFLGMMAQVAPDILRSLKFDPDQRVISLMAGAKLSEIGTWVSPAQAAAVMIPFPGIAEGGSPIMVHGDVELVGALFGDRNSIFNLENDTEMDAYLSAQAVLSPAVRMVQDAAEWLGSRVADEHQAEAFLRTLVGSSLLGSETRSLLQALNTPGGYNARLREHMVQAGMSDNLKRGLDEL